LKFYLKKIIIDSINKNQPEENTKNLFGEEAIKKIKELINKSGICFFCPPMLA
jgi:hypothetical protein